MRTYLAILSARTRTLLQYRAAAIAGFGTQLFWGFIRVMIFTAFYASSTAVQPISYKETVIYVWLGQAMLLLAPWNMDSEITALVRGGNVAYELIKPVSIYWLWFSRAIALRLSPLLLRAPLVFIVAGLFFGLSAPPSLASAAAFCVSIITALLLSSSITTLMNISLFWTISGEGLTRLLPGLVMLLSGQIIPLPFFPEWAQPILNFLPFRGIIDVPFRLYMGHIPPQHLPQLLLHQLAWTFAIILIGKIMLSRGLRRTVVFGG